jgi:hypothetical protein
MHDEPQPQGVTLDLMQLPYLPSDLPSRHLELQIAQRPSKKLVHVDDSAAYLDTTHAGIS